MDTRFPENSLTITTSMHICARDCCAFDGQLPRSRIPGGDEVPRHPATLAGPQRLAAVTTVMAVGLVLPSMINSGGHPASGARPAASHASAAKAAKTVWAATASGRKVPVRPPKFIPTPVHPEKITHPGADTMQTVTAAHGKWRKAVQMRPAITTMQLPGIDISAYQGNINWG